MPRPRTHAPQRVESLMDVEMRLLEEWKAARGQRLRGGKLSMRGIGRIEGDRRPGNGAVPSMR